MVMLWGFVDSVIVYYSKCIMSLRQMVLFRNCSQDLHLLDLLPYAIHFTSSWREGYRCYATGRRVLTAKLKTGDVVEIVTNANSFWVLVALIQDGQTIRSEIKFDKNQDSITKGVSLTAHSKGMAILGQ